MRLEELNKDIQDKITTLRQEINKAREDYYNRTESMSNYEYDAKWDELKDLEDTYDLDDKVTEEVGAEVDEDNGRTKITHEYEAKSLGKTKSVSELIKEQSKTSDGKDGKTCLSWKLDGCTLQLTYDKGKLVLASTRGNGKVGSDVTDNAKYVKGIPQTIDYMGKLTVRGECLMSYEEFDRLNTDGQYANPRNLASATITALDKNVIENRQLNFMAFELVHSETNITDDYAKQLDYLRDDLKFDVVPHEVVKISELEKKIAEWSTLERLKALGFPVDGLVVAFNDTTKTKGLQDTGHHPSKTKSMAFKWQDETMETVLRKIEWSPSRTGLLNPVAIFDTVNLCGTEVSRASLHNISYIKALNLQPGDRIEVYKANMIIPQLAKNLDRDKQKTLNFDIECPCCKSKGQIHISKDTKIETLYCENEQCIAKELGKFVHFTEKEGMNIEGLAEKSILVLMENKIFTSLADIFTLSEANRSQFTSIEGLGDKAFDNLLKAINKAKSVDTEHFLYACGIEGISKGQIKEITKYIRDNYDSELKDYHKPDMKCEGIATLGCLINMAYRDYDFTKINGIGKVLATNLQKFIDDEIIFPMEEKQPGLYYDVIKYLNFTDKLYEKSKDNINNGITGKTFVITGDLNHFKNRDELIDKIEELGGKVTGSVSKNTDYLINNDINSTSNKNKKAQSLNIPIITEEDFLSMINTKSDVSNTSMDTKDEDFEIDEDDYDEICMNM